MAQRLTLTPTVVVSIPTRVAFLFARPVVLTMRDFELCYATHAMSQKLDGEWRTVLSLDSLRLLLYVGYKKINLKLKKI